MHVSQPSAHAVQQSIYEFLLAKNYSFNTCKQTEKTANANSSRIIFSYGDMEYLHILDTLCLKFVKSLSLLNTKRMSDPGL